LVGWMWWWWLRPLLFLLNLQRRLERLDLKIESEMGILCFSPIPTVLTIYEHVRFFNTQHVRSLAGAGGDPKLQYREELPQGLPTCGSTLRNPGRLAYRELNLPVPRVVFQCRVESRLRLRRSEGGGAIAFGARGVETTTRWLEMRTLSGNCIIPREIARPQRDIVF